MSSESYEWLNRNVLIGMTGKRGTAWHYKASDQGDEPNHYPQAIPVSDVARRLFDWEAVPVPVYVGIPGTDEAMLVEDRQALVASDDHSVLGIHGGGYVDHQFRPWLLDGVGQLLDDDLVVSSAGLLKGRTQAWVEVSMPENLKAPGDVEYRPNLLACTSHDGSLATTYKRTITAVVCDNTLAMAMGERNTNYRIKHTSGSGLRIAEARDALEILYADADSFAAEIGKLVGQKVSQRQWQSVLAAMFPETPVVEAGPQRKLRTRAFDKRDEVDSLWRTDGRVAPWKGTAFGVLQAFNTWNQHMRPSREGTVIVERNMSDALSGKTEAQDRKVLAVLAGVN